jgi:tetratricopeptide (TPR) repeat protein
MAVWMVATAVALAGGCARKRTVTDRDRKEAAHLASEAQFAMSVREWPRAEGLLAKAVQASPEGDYWLSLGAARVRLANRSGAKAAYEAALKAYASDAMRNAARSDAWVKQVYVLALLGRREDSRALIIKAATRFPNDAKIRGLLDAKEFEKMVTAPTFKDMAL